MHRSVFLEESIRELHIKPQGKYIDGTFGEGGHSNAILAAGGIVLGIEADALQHQKHVNSSIKVVHGNFRNIEKIAKENNFYPVDGILLDLGLSMEQLNLSRRGFSYRRPEEPLDMRIEDSDITAAEILQKSEIDELKLILVKYSEDQFAEAIAQEVVATRNRTPYTTVADLTGAIRRVLANRGIEHEQTIEKTYARIFQALRIYVNDEFNSLKEALEGAITLLSPGGRIVVISFHSLEDRIVKLFSRERSEEIKHMRIEVAHERLLQKFERSAQLRVLEKLK
ncbi:16S rRNA (cytosine(1402)-N(4))-methyltransferase RsmH [soil metagenome]